MFSPEYAVCMSSEVTYEYVKVVKWWSMAVIHERLCDSLYSHSNFNGSWYPKVPYWRGRNWKQSIVLLFPSPVRSCSLAVDISHSG